MMIEQYILEIIRFLAARSDIPQKKAGKGRKSGVAGQKTGSLSWLAVQVESAGLIL